MNVICSGSSRIDDMPRKDQKDIVKVLRVLEKCSRYSVFEAAGNQTIATTMTKICQSGLIKTDNSCGYPWTKVELTDAGRRYLQRAQNLTIELNENHEEKNNEENKTSKLWTFADR